MEQSGRFVLPPLDTSRERVEPPEDITDAREWRKAVDNAKAQYQHLEVKYVL